MQNKKMYVNACVRKMQKMKSENKKTQNLECLEYYEKQKSQVLQD
ncbi:hypothetical protein [Helicobacter fennelliae]|nr:hypothetical protein [Helicobacter fennelliae]